MKLPGVLSLLVLATSVSAEPVKVEFKQPHKTKYTIEASAMQRGEKWLPTKAEGSTNMVELGHRVVVQVEQGSNVDAIMRGRSLKKDRDVSAEVYVFEAADAVTALQEAESLAKHPKVRAVYPVARESAVLDGAFAPLPNDVFFYRFLLFSLSGTNGFYGQWNLENRTFEGTQMGADINIRTAWPFSRGSNVVVAVADTGIETTHQELRNTTAGAPHWDFAAGTTNVIPSGTNGFWAHGTMVSGIIGAEANNNQGIAGIAHRSKVAGWNIFHTNGMLVSEEKLMEMYQFASNAVSVQNHSWSKGGTMAIKPMGVLESIGFSNAIHSGRNGLGSVIVRSAGNDRANSRSSNDRGETANPWAITVGASGYHGRVATYSENSAAVLVSAPSGDPNAGTPNLFTTDLVGTRGHNPIGYFNDLDDYAWDVYGFNGTSASAPQIAGIAALIVSANPELHYRDVQQILIHSAKQWDLEDPDLKTNAAGFRVSHNLGFGIPNSGEAVRLARSWTSRPALTNAALRSTNVVAIPDAGLRVFVTGDNLPPEISSIIAEPTQRGPHPDSPTPALPLVDVGSASNAIPQDLSGYGAVSPRDATAFSTKINNAAAAGAAFTIICNNSTNGVFAMAATDFTKIPAVCIPKSAGETLRAYMSNNVATAKLELQSATYTFNITNSLSCEHVGLRIKSDHPQRGDLRITLTSPRGTRSVLQFLNPDANPIPGKWTYFSTHHFYENSVGTWTAAITDEVAGGSGSVQEIELVVLGTEIEDVDYDGMVDSWEVEEFGNLSATAAADPDKDGYSNLREAIIGTNPQQPNAPLSVDLARFNSGYYRARWPSSTDFNYEVWFGADPANMSVVTNIPGNFPESDFVFSSTNSARFVRVVQKVK